VCALYSARFSVTGPFGQDFGCRLQVTKGYGVVDTVKLGLLVKFDATDDSTQDVFHEGTVWFSTYTVYC
jgi:hypothetical protein